MNPRRGLLAVVALLAGINVAGIWLPGWTYLPRNLLALMVLLAVARRAGATTDDLGLRSNRWLPGIRLGLLIAVVLVAGILITAVIPSTRNLFDDDRAAGIGIAGLLYQTVLRIPIGTALFEEFAFRGVLLGLGRKGWGQTAGTFASALLFGMWHIAPAVSLAETNAGAHDRALPLVIGLAVVSTAVAGLAFSWIRDRSESLAAPVIVHAAVNSAAFTAAWLLL